MGGLSKRGDTVYGHIWRSIAAVVALVFALGGTAVTVYVDRSITDGVEEKERAFLAGVDAILSYQISSAQQTLDMLLANPFIVQSIYTGDTSWSSSVYQSGQTILNAISSNQVYNSIYVISGDQIALKSSRRYQTPEDEARLIEDMQLRFRQKLIPWRSVVGGRASHNLTLLSALDTVATPNVTGGVMINLDLDRLAERAFAGSGAGQVYLALGDQIVAATRSDAFFTDLSQNELLFEAVNTQKEICGGHYVFSHTNPAYGYTLYAVQPRDTLMSPVKSGLLLLLAIISAFLAVTLLVSRRAAQHAYTPVKTILIQLEEQLPGHEGAGGELGDLQRVSRSIRRTSEIVSAYRHDAETTRLARFMTSGAADHRVSETLQRLLGYDGSQPLYMLLFKAQDPADTHAAADVLQGTLDGFARFLTLDMPERRLLSLICVTHPSPEDETILSRGIEQVLRLLREQGTGKTILTGQGPLPGAQLLPEAYAQMAERMRSGAFCDESALLAPPVSGELPQELVRQAQAAAQSGDSVAFLQAARKSLARCAELSAREGYHQLATLCVRVEEAEPGAASADRLDTYRRHLGALLSLRDYDAILSHMLDLYQSVSERIGEKRARSGSHPLSEPILSYMADHFSDPALSAAQVADALGISVSHLSRVMSKAIGSGFPELLQKMRLEHAAALLLSQSDLPIAQLARQCGFSSASYFTASFKRVYGVTPRHYRLQHAANGAPKEDTP